MVASRSAPVLDALTNPNASMRARSAASSENARVDSTCANSVRVRAGSRPSASNTKRSKFDAFEMSIDGLEVSCVSAALRAR